MDISLTVDTYFEFFLTLSAWVIHNELWDLLTHTGVFALPFLFNIASLFLKVREEGDDEGNKGRLLATRIENSIYLSLLVIIFTCLPVFKVSYSTLQLNTERMKECGVSVYKPQDTTIAGISSELSGKNAVLPIWWAFTYSLGKGITHGAIAAIPCKPDLRQIRFEVQNTQITNPVLRREVQDFVEQCFIPARAKVKRQQIELDEVQSRDVDWIGSNLFLNTPGFYDIYRSKLPRAHWAYDPNRDSGLPNTGNGGFPSCREWWADSSVGLKSRVLEQVNPDTLTKIQKLWKSDGDYTDLVVRRLVSPQNILVSSGRVYGGYGSSSQFWSSPDLLDNVPGFVTFGAGALGATAGGALLAPAFDTIKQALPMVQGLILLAVVIGIPLVTIFSGYSVKAIVTLTFVQFSFFFLSFWWELARWIDTWMLETLYNSDTHSKFNFAGIMNDADDGILKLVVATMFLVLPTLWFLMLGWAGLKAGQGLSNIIGDGVKSAQNATQKTTDKVVK
ncbi:conjugal transfer protein TraG N-terminal domain-containing protein [Ursidibacter maritimus]|uniref:conjugal transfer protein TraG N-terminal domain-containing protein n=1 Tax=Ursidibacter maritimus TaxID=1331689 RepID=UPI001C48DEF1|nr:conjugal transfer protein TraG N-terminal domain-containing protein [Ursidibacter maritimus]MBV6540735.1 conjugal transfer protein TraG N-terminal domain-containing protein [Ursidibacter maritimus]